MPNKDGSGRYKTPQKLQLGISKLQEIFGYPDNPLFVLGHFSGVDIIFPRAKGQ